MEQYSLREAIAKYKYDLELQCLRRDDLMIQINNVKKSMETYPEVNHGYALDILNNNYNMALLTVERYKIEILQLKSQLQ
jgi:hypothetical protein